MTSPVPWPALRLGTLTLTPPVLLAPMSALTNLPMRTLAEELGCALTFTEFLPAQALAARRPNAKALGQIASLTDQPFGVQLYGHQPEQIQRAAAVAVSKGAAVVDLNMGCPTRKVTGGLCGAALMRDPELAQQLVHAAVEGVGGSAIVSVKMRTGWDEQHRNAPALASRLVDAGAEMITVHGRTRMQAYEGVVDHATIAEVKKQVSVPVIANGDIVDIATLDKTLRVTGADGAMIGRAALGNVWIFRDIAAWYQGKPSPAPPSRRERIEMYLRHLTLYLEIADEYHAVIEMRKYARPYLTPLPDGERLRQRINHLNEVVAIRDLLEAAM